MQTPYEFNLGKRCPICKVRRSGLFCHMSPAELRDFDKISSISGYPPGAVLFSEEQPARGIFQVCAGEVKLSINSSEGKTLVLKVAGPGDVLGMAAVLSGGRYEATAESLRPCHLAFVSVRDFRCFLQKYPAAFRRAADYLALQYKGACERLSVIGLGASVLDRLVRFLLDRSAKDGGRENESRFSLPLSHEEIGEHIGASRETISRTLSALRKRGLLESHRSTLVIPNRAALAAFRLYQARPSGVGPQLVRTAPAILKRHAQGAKRSQREQYGNGARRKQA